MTMTTYFRNSNDSTSIRAVLIFVIVCGILVYVFVTKLNTSLLLERLNEALKEVDKSSQKNDELKKIIENFLNDKIIENSHNIGVQPLLEYEELRRRVRQHTQEMWNYFSSELEKIRKNLSFTNEMSDQIVSVLQLGAEHKRSLISDIDKMRSVDGYELWRHQEANNLSDLVQKRLSYIQNPISCNNANKLVFNLNDVKSVGYGSLLHLLVYWFIEAYAAESTIIFKSKDWIYHKGGWEKVFEPVSETCTEYEINRARNRIVAIPLAIPCIPLSIPEDLAPRLSKLHGYPSVWWVAQFLKYLLKPITKTQKMLEIGMVGMEKLGWKKPIVGIHIRRTDKIDKDEAVVHTIEEYMAYVEDYYLTLDLNSTQKVERRVFLASDDPSIITEARTKYPQYKIIGDPNIAKTANISTRYTHSSLNGIILDVHILSLSDYLVCTFSSNVCRLAYEIMQSYYPDASDRFKSLDTTYYYCLPNTNNSTVLLPHKPRNKDEIYLELGDLIVNVSNHWNGFSEGTNTRINKFGLFPSFKVKNIIITNHLPTYSNVN